MCKDGIKSSLRYNIQGHFKLYCVEDESSGDTWNHLWTIIYSLWKLHLYLPCQHFSSTRPFRWQQLKIALMNWWFDSVLAQAHQRVCSVAWCRTKRAGSQKASVLPEKSRRRDLITLWSELLHSPRSLLTLYSGLETLLIGHLCLYCLSCHVSCTAVKRTH